MQIDYNKVTADFSPAQRGDRAKEIFETGYNCCQAVVLAFADLILNRDGGVSDEDLKAATSGFGGGMGRMREVCGTVSGMTFMAGVISPATDPSQQIQRTANYALVQKFAASFREVNGSIICRDLLSPGQTPATAHAATESPVPSQRSPEYYRKRPCAELCAMAARIVAEEILSRKQSLFITL